MRHKQTQKENLVKSGEKKKNQNMGKWEIYRKIEIIFQKNQTEILQLKNTMNGVENTTERTDSKLMWKKDSMQ